MNKAPSTGSLNCKVRIDEMKRIWQDNQKILRQISTIKSHYPVSDLKKDAKFYSKVKRNISFNSSKKVSLSYYGRSVPKEQLFLESG